MTKYPEFAIIDTRNGTEHKATLLNATTIEEAEQEAFRLLPDAVQEKHGDLASYQEQLDWYEYYLVAATVWPMEKEPEADDWIDRLREEEEQFKDRLEKLDDFIDSEVFRKLDGQQRTWLNMQQAYMRAYWSVLNTRLAYATKDDEAQPAL